MEDQKKDAAEVIQFEDRALELMRTELAKASPTNRSRIFEKFILAALGSIPWVGGFVSLTLSYRPPNEVFAAGRSQLVL